MRDRGVCRVGMVAVLFVMQACKVHGATLPSFHLCIDFCSDNNNGGAGGGGGGGLNPADTLVMGVSPLSLVGTPPNYQTQYSVGTRVSLYLVRVSPGGNPMVRADTVRTVRWASSNDAVARFANQSEPGRGDLDGLAPGQVRIQVNGALGTNGAPLYSTIWACGQNAYPGGSYGGSCAPLDSIRFVP